jgi:DNA-binding MarR family transcriptional regulator
MADIVRRLVKRGLLSRRRTRQDARTYAVSLTSEAHRILDQMLPIATTVDAALIADLAVEEQKRFTSLLQNIVGHLIARSSNDEDHKPDPEPQTPVVGRVSTQL